MRNLLDVNEKLIKQFEDENFNFLELERDVEEHSNLMKTEIFNAVEKNEDKDSEIGKNILKTQKSMRKIGTKFLNLFKITFSVEFAGVTLIYFTIPKVDSDGNIKK